MTQNNNTPWWRITNGAARLAARQAQTAPRQQQFSPQIPPSTDVSQDPAYQSALSGAAPLPPWSDTPISPAAQQPGTIAPPEERPATPAWLRDIANNLWRTSRTLNPIAAAVAPMPDDYGAQLADTFWSGNVPSGFAPEDTWLGKVERNRARDVMRPIWKAQSGDVGGAIRDVAQSQALSTAGGQGVAAVADVSGRIFNPQPGQEPVKFGDAAGAVMGAIGGSSIPFAPRELFDVMNVAPQAAETLVGRLGAAIPDTVKIGNVELPNPIKGPGFNMFANAAKFADAPRSYVENLASAVISGDHAKLYSAIGLTGSKDIKAQAQEFQAGLGVDLTAKWRGKNAAISDPAGALESSLFQSPEEYAMWRAAPMAASGSQAYLTGIKRILAGEDPQAVIKGEYMPAPRQELFIDERNRYDEVVKRHIEAAGVLAEQGALRAGQPYAVVQEQGEAARAMADKQVRETGMVRGEESPLAELFAQTVIGFAMARGGLDPVNRIPFHQMFGLKAFMPTPKRPNILNEVYDSAAEVAGKTYKMGEALEATKRGLSPEQLAGEARALSTLDAARKAQAPAPPPSEGAVAAPRERAPTLMARAGAAAYLTYIHAVEFLPQAKAKGAAGYALDLIHSLTRDAQNPMEAFAALRQWILDPSSMRATYDTVPVSFKAELARPIIEGLGGGDKAKAIEVLGKLAEKAAKAEELAARAAEARAKTGESTEEAQAKRFTSLGFLGEMAPLLQKSAETIHGVKPLAERSAIERWGTEVKSWLGEFYLRTLGYVFRNTMSDSVVMAMDGLYSFEGMKQIESHMGKIGLTEDYIKSESQAEGSGQESKLAKIPIIGPIQGWVGKTNNNWEVARRTRAFYNGFKQFMGLNWEPAIGADVVQALGPELAHVANTLRDGWRSGQTVNEIKAATLKALKNRVAGFDATGFPLDAKMAAVLSPELQARTRADMQRIYDENRVALGDEAAKTKALDEATAKAKTTIEADYIRRIAALGPVVNPSPSSVRTFQEDQQEFEQTMTKLAKDTLPAGPERDALVEQLKRGYSEREQAIIAARDLVAKRLAGLPANAPAEDVAKLIVYAHEVDHQIRNTTRLAQDAAVKEAWDAIAGMGKRGSKQARSADMRAVWDDYRAKNDPVQQKMSADIATSYEWVADAIERLTTDPTSFEAIAKERPDWDKNGDFAGSVIREAVNLAKGEYTRFEDVLNLTRSGIDLARANAFALAKRLATGDSTVAARVFDVLSTAERDVTRHAAITLGEIRAALARKDAGQITFDQYKDIADEKWGEHGRWARTRYNEYAMNSLTWVEIESGQLAKGLRELGYSNEQIADLLKKAATSDNGAAIAKIFEKATGPTTPPADGKPPPDQPGLFPDGGTPAPKPPPGAPPAPGGAEAGPAAKPAAQIAEEAKNLAADARDLAARAKISPTADNIDLAREAEARAKPSREAIIMERMAVRAEETAKRTPTEANKAAAVKARQIADESWLSYEQERLNPTPKPAPAPLTQGTGTGELPTAPGKKPIEQRVYEIVATTNQPDAAAIARTLRIGQAHAEKLIADAQARLAQEKSVADARAAQDAQAPKPGEPLPKLDLPPADTAATGEAPKPAALDARVEPLAYDISGVDPRRVSVIDAANDKSYATVLMIVPSDKVRGSHDSEGRPTPGFNPELQQRGSSREGAAFVNQRQKITTGFKAGIVTEIPRDPTKGVSIVESPTPYPDGTFQLAGGNMRKSAEDWIAQNQSEGVAGKADSLQALYDQRRAAARAAGISEAEIAAAGDAPFLVRAIVSDLKDPTDTFKTRAAYAAYLSNKPAIASMSSTERATEIGRFITPDMLTAFQIKEGQNLEAAVADPDNAAILQKIKSKLLPVELSGLMSENNVTTYGKQIIAAAIFQKAYPSASGERIAAAILNDTAASVGDSNIAAGMMKTLRSTLELETQIRSGQLPADLSITPEVSRALEAFEYARQHPSNKRGEAADAPLATKIGTALDAAMDMFAAVDEAARFSPTERAVALVMALNREAPNQIASFIDQYNTLALQQREMGASLTKEEIINRILEDNLQRENTRVDSDRIAELRGALKAAKKQGNPDAVQQAQNELDAAQRLREEQKGWPAQFQPPVGYKLDVVPRPVAPPPDTAPLAETTTKHTENWDATPVIDRVQAVIDAVKQNDISPDAARKIIDEIAPPTRKGPRTPEEEAEAVRAKQAETEQARYGGAGPDLAAQNAKGLADLQGATAPRPVPADAGGAGRPPVEPPGPPPPPGEPPAPDPRNIDPDAQTPENIALQESALHNEGDHEAPRFEDMAKAAFQEQRSALDAMRKSAEEYNARPIPEGALTPEAEAAIFRAEAEAIRKYNRTFDAAKTYAREATNFTLLDYAQKRGFDTWLSAIAPFSYWATRQGRNFALRLMQNPAYLTAYLRFKLALEDENRKRWTRSRFKGSVKIPLSDISGGKMNDIYADPIEVFFPFAGLMGQDVTDPEGQRTGVQQVYNMAETLGLRPSPPIDIALRASGALQADNSPEQQAAWGRGSIGAFTPQGSMIQGATAALGIGGPGGWNPEEPIRRAVGLPDTVAYDPYRYGRSVADISAVLNVMQGESMDPRPFLAAQEWIGKHRDSDLANQLRKATPDDVAKELNIDPKLAVQALEIARAGARQASKQRAVGQLGSSLLGLRLQELPQGEMIRTGMADAERGAAFNPATGTGSREAVKAVQAQYPALQVQRGQYQALPGDSRDSSYLFDNAQKQIVNKAFDQLSESVLTARPWDRRATRLVEDARYTALARTDRTSPSAPGDWQTEYQRAVAKIAGGDSVTATAPNLAYRPLSVAGASPAEATQIRQQEIMRAIVRTQPRAEAFTKQDGQIDFAAYNAARADWESALPTIAKGIPEVFAVVGQADKEGRGVNLRAWLDKLGPDQLDEYKRRNDTPLEAAQRTYFEGIYQPAMDAYRKASDLGVPDAWNQTVGKLGTVRGSDIVPMMQQVYGNRFSPEELASLNTLAFPPAQDVMRANMSDSAKIKDAARSAFWDFMNTATPPGSPSYSLRQEALIGAALDQSSRATVTAEQYALALSMARGWVATNYGEVTPEMQAEWNSARAAKKELDNLILTQLGPEGAIALRAYQAAQSASDKAAVRRSNPIVQKALNLQLLFANKNEVFGKYYKSAKGAAVARIKSIRR